VPAIVALNPALLRLSTPSDIPYDLHLPPGTRQTYLDRLKDIPEENRTSWRFHVVKAGETLDSIAASMHTTPSAIASYNDIAAADPVEADDELVIPIAAAASARAERYTLRRGDTLITVADRFGVTVEQLRAWNKLSSNRAAPGRSLYVAEPVKLAPHGSARSRRGSRSAARRGRQSSHAEPAAYHTGKASPGKASSSRSAAGKTSASRASNSKAPSSKASSSKSSSRNTSAIKAALGKKHSR
jgi:membrane-bound lytic murein transglycosylase D